MVAQRVNKCVNELFECVCACICIIIMCVTINYSYSIIHFQHAVLFLKEVKPSEAVCVISEPWRELIFKIAKRLA